jgi:hypothetical protein
MPHHFLSGKKNGARFHGEAVYFHLPALHARPPLGLSGMAVVADEVFKNGDATLFDAFSIGVAAIKHLVGP